MSTPAEEAIAAGIESMELTHGKTWTFGAGTFTGWRGSLTPEDPLFQVGDDRTFTVSARTSSTTPVETDEGKYLTSDGYKYRIIRVDVLGNGLTRAVCPRTGVAVT